MREHALRRFLNKAYVADHAAAVYAAAYFVWMLLRTPGTAATEIISVFAFVPLGLAIGWACWRVGRVPALDRRTRLAWYLLSLSALSLWTTGNLWSLYLLVVNPQHSPAWLDIIEPLNSLLAIAAYLLFPTRTSKPGSRQRARLDVALIVVAGFVLAFHFGVRTMFSQAAPVWGYTVALMVVDWVMFVSAAVGVIQKRDATIRIVLAILLAAHTSSLIGNYWLSDMARYRVGDAVDALWFLAWVLKWAAARVAWHRHRLGLVREDDQADEPGLGFRASVFANVMVGGVFGLLVIQLLGGDRKFLELMGISTLAMVVLLSLRQVAALAENRRLFAAQLAQEARFRSLVHNASDLVLVVDGSGVISYVSPSGVRMFGDHPALRIGARITDLFPLEDAAPLATTPGGIPAGTLHVLTRVETASGEWRDVEVISTDQREDPAVAGMVFTCRDITERRALERKLMHAQKLDAVGRLAGGLAHDLNNVLAAIRGYAELLADELPAGTSAAADLRNIQEASDKASGITKKLLGLSRNQSVQRGTLNLNDVVRGLQPILRQLLTDRIEVRLELDPDAGLVKADLGQMEQVLVNLATNARDAMPAGGLLRVRTANVSIGDDRGKTCTIPPGDYVTLAVTDEGVGMSADVQARVFEPFFTTRPEERGMGLGLPMVREIVEETGGCVTVESKPGRGSTFTVLLPRLGDATKSSSKVPAVEGQTTQTGFVLLVDDEESVRTVARRILQRRGYRVVEAPGGVEALAIAEDMSVPIDVLLTDMVMPGMHGRDLIERFKAIRPDVPVVCVSGFADDNDAAADLGSSVIALVTKPFSSDTLMRALSKIGSR
ncbi:MAG: response regulator [Acidobacteria bacterium]|nr:response regulator [Acidobacteriota bacterium]